MRTVLLGPALAGLAAVVGRLLGAALDVWLAVAILAALALGLALAIARWRRNGWVGVAAAALWMFVGGMNADLGHGVAMLERGEHLTGARLADVAAWRGHARVTFVDGALRGDLSATAGHDVDDGGKGVHGHHRVWCAATPLVPAGWTEAAPVPAWTLDDRPSSQPLAAQTLHPIDAPGEDCRRAIDDAIAAHHLVPGGAPLYLERLETSADPAALRDNGLLTAIVLGATWLLGFGWSAARDALARRGRRKDRV